MATASASFQYDRIDIARDAIRLIRLCKGFDTNPICCELSEVLLDEVEGVPYSALSYTWGDASQRVDIILNGHTISITANLYHALYCLRKTDIDQYLWVDAICIDQNHHGERSHQVGQMRRVYEKAENVIIWLGRTTDEIDLLLDVVNTLDRRIKKIPRGKQKWPETWQSEWNSLVTEMGGKDTPFYQLRKQALQELLSRAWFKRIWVIQEAASARTATIACAWKSAPTRTFAVMPFLMGVKTEKRQNSLLEAMPGPLRKSSIWNTPPQLHTLLTRFDDSHSEDPRDQIYGLLGISFDAAGSSSRLLANYQLDISQTLRETASFLLFGEVLAQSIFSPPSLTLRSVRQPLRLLGLDAFQWALKQSNIVAADKLLTSKHATINESLPGGKPSLEFATVEGASFQMIAWLLDWPDLDVGAHQQGLAALCHAAENGRTAIVELLLSKKGGEITYLRSDGMTPLAHAIKGGHLGIAKKVMDHYPTWTYKFNINSRTSPLIVAAENGRTEIIQHLLSHWPKDKLDDLVFTRREALLGAAHKGHLEAATVLINAGAGADGGPNRFIQSPLQLALREGHASMVQLLLEKNDQPLNPGGRPLKLPLCEAARAGHFQALSLVVHRAAHLVCSCAERSCPAAEFREEFEDITMDVLRNIWETSRRKGEFAVKRAVVKLDEQAQAKFEGVLD